MKIEIVKYVSMKLHFSITINISIQFLISPIDNKQPIIQLCAIMLQILARFNDDF